MDAVPGMHLAQTKEEVSGLQCVHSKAAASLFPMWEYHWSIGDLEDTDMSYKVFCNQDARKQTFLDTDRFLAAIQHEGRVTLLFTVWRKQKFPSCTNMSCSKQTKCLCYRKYKKILDEEENDGESTYYWDRRTRPTPAVIDHFLQDLPSDQHHLKHGHNHTKMLYPIKRCPELQQKFLYRLDGVYNLPEKILPKLAIGKTCHHGNSYVEDDEKLKKMSPNITIYTETSDKVCAIPTYGRPTQGGCTCHDQEDTHELLLWNLGSGQFIDYMFSIVTSTDWCHLE